MRRSVRQKPGERSIRRRLRSACCFCVALLLIGPRATAQEPTPAAEPGDPPLFALETPIGEVSYRAGRGLQLGDTGLHLGGFTTAELDREDSGPLEVELDSINFLIGWQPHPLVSAFSELEVGHLFRWQDSEAPGSRTRWDAALTVERLYGDLSLDDPLNFRVGKFQTPVGRWNLVPAEPFTWTANEPVLVTTAFEEFQTGGAFYGSVYPGAGALEYWLYGQFVDAFDPEGDEEKATRSVGGRLQYGTELSGGSLGTSFLATRLRGDWSYLGGLDAMWAGGPLEIESEFDYQRGDIPGRDLWGVFVQAVCEVLPGFHLVARYEYFDPEGDHQDANLLDLGVAWIPRPWLRVKATYRTADRQTDEVSRGLTTSVSLVF